MSRQQCSIIVHVSHGAYFEIHIVRYNNSMFCAKSGSKVTGKNSSGSCCHVTEWNIYQQNWFSYMRKILCTVLKHALGCTELPILLSLWMSLWPQPINSLLISVYYIIIFNLLKCLGFCYCLTEYCKLLLRTAVLFLCRIW